MSDSEASSVLDCYPSPIGSPVRHLHRLALECAERCAPALCVWELELDAAAVAIGVVTTSAAAMLPDASERNRERRRMVMSFIGNKQ